MPCMRRSGTTPTIVSHGSFEFGRMRFIWRPVASTFGKCVRAKDSLTMATGWLVATSAGVNSRPLSSGVWNVEKYPAVTMPSRASG